LGEFTLDFSSFKANDINLINYAVIDEKKFAYNYRLIETNATNFEKIKLLQDKMIK